MGNNKDRVLRVLREAAVKGGMNFTGVETQTVADALGIRRNVASQLLNELIEQRFAEKTKTRPVLYRPTDVGEAARDPFASLVGHNGSLRLVVEQCKSAAFYPSGDMPVLLTGASGVGKSYIARLLAEYARAEGKIAPDAPFVVFNCADYAANPELLSANLFGYKKGAFTGADGDRAGVLEAADGGYLFLDEVHRLPPEGQEKFFVFMDQGIFKRLGESRTERRANVRFVFATTEEPRRALLATFLRRIPLTVRIPSLEERPIGERLALVYRFFREEAARLDRDFEVARPVVNAVLSHGGGGNIGSIRNFVRFLSACAYKDQNGAATLCVDRRYLPLLGDSARTSNKQLYGADAMRVARDGAEEAVFRAPDDEKYRKLDAVVGEVDRLLAAHRSRRGVGTARELKKKLDTQLNRALEIMVYAGEDAREDLTENLYLDAARRTLQSIEGLYGIRYYGNTAKVVAKILLFAPAGGFEETPNDARLERIGDCFAKEFGKVKIIADKIVRSLERELDLRLEPRAAMFLSLYAFSTMTHEAAEVNGIIAAHGYSTASSIAAVANQMFSQFVFEAFDMPIQSSPDEVAAKIRQYLLQLSNAKDTILLVDMGSLTNLDASLKDAVAGDLGIINNITTNIALEVANRILQGERVEAILRHVEENSRIVCKFVRGRTKRKAILTSCISGIGTAVKLRDILRECVDGAVVEACEYGELRLKGREAAVFQTYDVRLVISTTPLCIAGVECLMFQDLMDGGGDVLLRALAEFGGDRDAADIQSDLVKLFSLENVLSRLTILNPHKIIDEVESIVARYERRLGAPFSARLKLSLYIHVSVLIERLMLKQGAEFTDEEAVRYSAAQAEFIALSREIFRPVAAEYRLELTLKEIYLLQTILGGASAPSAAGWDE